MKGRKPSRGAQHIELLAAMAEEGCPVCHQIAGSDDHFFFWFFNENYYEPFMLDALTRSLGFCLGHGARLTRSVAGSDQLAAVHEVLVRRVRRMLAGGPSARPPHMEPGSALATLDRCPACRDRGETAGRNGFWMAGLLEEPSSADLYGKPGMLCFPHLQAVLPRVSALTFDRLLSVHTSAMTSALESLRELGGEVHGGKALLPSLRLAVGHDTGNGAYPAPGDSRQSRRRDPVGEFLEVLRRGEGCPVCLEVGRGWMEWIGWLDDATSRTVVVEDLLPTCPEHVWPAAQLGGADLAIAAARQALDAALSQIHSAVRVLKAPPSQGHERLAERLKRTLLGPRHRLRAARETVGRPLRCQVCERLAGARDRALALVFALLEDRQHRAEVERGYGLCLKHFSRALALDPLPPVRVVLLEVEAAKLARLQWELEEALRKVAWGVRPEAKGAEQTAWRRAVVRFSGSLTEGVR